MQNEDGFESVRNKKREKKIGKFNFKITALTTASFELSLNDHEPNFMA